MKKFLLIGIGVVLGGALVFWLMSYVWLRLYGRWGEGQPAPSEIMEFDRVFTQYPAGFPPDPGEAGKATIEGIDADQDGVRDDVQRWIYAYVPEHPDRQMALRKKARQYFKYNLSENLSAKQAEDAGISSWKSIQCLFKVFPEGEDGFYRYNSSHYLHAKVLNTFARVKRYWENEGVAYSESSSRYIEYESPCENR